MSIAHPASPDLRSHQETGGHLGLFAEKIHQAQESWARLNYLYQVVKLSIFLSLPFFLWACGGAAPPADSSSRFINSDVGANSAAVRHDGAPTKFARSVEKLATPESNKVKKLSIVEPYSQKIEVIDGLVSKINFGAGWTEGQIDTRRARLHHFINVATNLGVPWELIEFRMTQGSIAKTEAPGFTIGSDIWVSPKDQDGFTLAHEIGHKMGAGGKQPVVEGVAQFFAHRASGLETSPTAAGDFKCELTDATWENYERWSQAIERVDQKLQGKLLGLYWLAVYNAQVSNGDLINDPSFEEITREMDKLAPGIDSKMLLSQEQDLCLTPN